MTMCPCQYNSKGISAFNTLPTFVTAHVKDKNTNKETTELVNVNQISRLTPKEHGATIYYNTCDNDGNIIGRSASISEKNYSKLNIRA